MTEVQTVRGPVGLDALGETMVHEHVFFWNWGQEEKRAASIAYARKELRKLAMCGARTPEPFRSFDEGQCIERFCRELLEGIGDSDIRAALIKAASNPQFPNSPIPVSPRSLP